MRFLESDATLLQAILFGCGSSSVRLNSVLNTLVSLEREMLTFAEFDGGLARLQAGGLVTFDSGLVTPTTDALDIAAEISRHDGCPVDFYVRLAKVLASWPLENVGPRGYTTGALSSADYDKAFA